MFHVEFTPQAIEDLSQLDKGRADRIATRFSGSLSSTTTFNLKPSLDALPGCINSGLEIGVCCTPLVPPWPPTHLSSLSPFLVPELELLAYPDLTQSEEAHIKAFLQDITVVELNSTVKSHAIDLRKRYRLKLPDALIVARAQAFNATLLTNDQQLLSLAAVPTRFLELN